MRLLLVLLFIVVPIAELFVIIQVGEAIGVLPTIALLIADSVLGSMLMRSQGRAAWRRFNAALAEGRVPHREVLDGALGIFCGALVLAAGVRTDVLRLVLLLPPPRAGRRRGSSPTSSASSCCCRPRARSCAACSSAACCRASSSGAGAASADRADRAGAAGRPAGVPAPARATATSRAARPTSTRTASR